MKFEVSSMDIQRARKAAMRNRSYLACARCKSGKNRCSDYRPCKRCSKSKSPCTDVSKSSDAMGSALTAYHDKKGSPSTLQTSSRNAQSPPEIESGSQYHAMLSMSQASDPARASYALREAANQAFLDPCFTKWSLLSPGPAPLLNSGFQRQEYSLVHNQARVSTIGMDALCRPMIGPHIAQSIIGAACLPVQQAPFLPMTTLATHPQLTIGQSSGSVLLPPTLAWLQALAASLAIPPPHASASADLRRLPV